MAIRHALADRGLCGGWCSVVLWLDLWRQAQFWAGSTWVHPDSHPRWAHCVPCWAWPSLWNLGKLQQVTCGFRPSKLGNPSYSPPLVSWPCAI